MHQHNHIGSHTSAFDDFIKTSPLCKTALEFATTWHGDQKRKYTNTPYIEHPIEVASILLRHGVTDEEMIAAALLHDVIEDTDATRDDLLDVFHENPTLVDYVLELTESLRTPGINRAMFKKLEAERLGMCSSQAQTIKLADMISNSDSIIKYDMGFAVVFMNEMQELMKAMTSGKQSLMAEAISVVVKYRFGAENSYKAYDIFND